MIFIVIFLILLLGLSVFFNYNLYLQVGQLETHIQKSYESNEKNLKEFDFFYKLFLRWFIDAKADLDRVDKRGAFSSDDEVGFAFRVIKESIEQTKARLESLQPQEKPPEN